VQTVFRSARPRRLQDSPALQRPAAAAPSTGAGAGLDANKSLSMLGLGGQPADIDVRNREANRAAAGANGGGANLARAVSDADAYFAEMRIQEQGDSFGGDGGRDETYVVNQYAPQRVYQPAQGVANGDLLM